MKNIFYLILFTFFLFISSCEKDIEGCTDTSAVNFNSDATQNDDSCLFDSDGDGINDSDEVLGCTIEESCNFNVNATDSDNDSCEYAATGFDCEGNVTTYSIGMEVEGGIIFYIDETGEHGLVAAIEDLQSMNWGCMVMFISGADGTSIGSGSQNSLDIISSCSQSPIAASACLAYEHDGYTDWHLPSRDELVEMYNTIGNAGPQGNIANFQEASQSEYWSSSEFNEDYAWSVQFSNGNSFYDDKEFTYNVRPIRSF